MEGEAAQEPWTEYARLEGAGGSIVPRWPVPELSIQSLPPCQRGECGIDSLSVTILLVPTSMIDPPSARRSRQPLTMSLRLTAVTGLGLPSSMAIPFRWQRSSAASLDMKGGFQ